MARRRPTQKQILVDKVYVVTLIWQCEAFITALHRARGESDKARRNADVTSESHFAHNQQAISDFQSALTFAGNISKIIWPIKKALRKHEVAAGLKRGRRIRKILGIKARDSVLFRSPESRNNFEHFDVRLDAWSQTTTGTSIGLHALASEKALAHISRGNRFTRYDPDADTFRILDDKIDLKRLEASVKRIWMRASSVYRSILRYETRRRSQGETA